MSTDLGAVRASAGAVTRFKWEWLSSGIVVRIVPNGQTAEVEWTELKGNICHLNPLKSVLSFPSSLSQLISVLCYV